MPIVISYHGTPESNVALNAAYNAAKDMDTELVVVLAAKTSEDDSRTLDTAQDTLWDLLKTMTVAYKVIRAKANVEIADSVLEVAREENASLIFIGLAGRQGIKGQMVGANAQKILLESVCPVVTVTENSTYLESAFEVTE